MALFCLLQQREVFLRHAHIELKFFFSRHFPQSLPKDDARTEKRLEKQFYPAKLFGDYFERDCITEAKLQ